MDGRLLIPSRDRAQAGLTLIEAVVAIAIVLIAMLPLAGIFWGGAKGQAVSAQRTQAISVANSLLATARSIPYDQLNLTSTQCGEGVGPGAPAGASCAASAAGLPPSLSSWPNPATTMGGETYHSTVYIDWVPAGAGATAAAFDFAKAYKLVTAVVIWKGTSLTESTIVYPGNLSYQPGGGVQ